ncbi:MAG: hypothetical protein QOD92_1714 [Acidimicrobiaceae bacterium]
MARVRVATTISLPPKAVWAAIEDISTHVNWMDDAVAIHFTSRRRHGVGTTFDCDTQVGPFSLVDQMAITEWKPGKVMGVRHEGLVKGSGRFTLRRRRGGRTRFTWDERLVVPWKLGGPIAAVPIAFVLRRVWRRNLRHLKAIVEAA